MLLQGNLGSHGEPMPKASLEQVIPDNKNVCTNHQVGPWLSGEAQGKLTFPKLPGTPTPKGETLATQFFKAAAILSLAGLSPSTMHSPPGWKCQPLG